MENNKSSGSEQSPNSIRDHLANERTFLAWIRTSIALMGFGFVIVKFAVFVREMVIVLGDKAPVMPKTYSAQIGVGMVVFGAITALLGYISFKNTERKIQTQVYSATNSLQLWVTIIIILVSAVLVYFLLPNL